MGHVKTYWWKEVPNFGDALTPLLLKHFSNQDAVWDTISRAKLICIGSILEHVPPLWDGYILGSGRLHEGSRLQLQQLRSGITVNVLAIRGPLSAKGIPGSYALGDPALLANELVGYQEKKWDLGIVPHWQDAELADKFEGLIQEPYTTIVIKPTEDPLDVLRKIGACRKIVTSSLHGMIIADSFGIPRRVELCAAMKRDGGNFKFRDYSASIQAPLIVGKVVEASRFRVEDRKFEIYDAFRALEKELK
jgi:hypothetical protein